ncbi:MAG: biopolymer transporter ExbD [Candidatus Omnitrophica bacterium]|nr:biopolymer transporter ExbD [Candidatus Omnitrophota bacterium]
MTDMVFLMLIFFTLTSSVVEMPNALTVALPQASQEGGTSTGHTVVTVTESGKILVGQDEVPASKLADRLKLEIKKDRLAIRSDRRAALEQVVNVWDAARIAGFKEVSVATEPKKEKKQS